MAQESYLSTADKTLIKEKIDRVKKDSYMKGAKYGACLAFLISEILVTMIFAISDGPRGTNVELWFTIMLILLFLFGLAAFWKTN